MENPKKIVIEKYGQIARSFTEKQSGANSCKPGCCTVVDYAVFSDSYENLAGYEPEADMGLGCGLPTEFAMIKEGDTVLDLGSGAGNDCFVARSLTGGSGRVIGLDFTPPMIEKARENAARLGYNNVEFILGDIEDMPIADNTADVIVSNCVLNLVPDKVRAFEEIRRVLKPGGHLSVSDVVVQGQLPEKIREAAELYAGCISGATDLDRYLSIMKNAGLINIKLQKVKPLSVPDEIFLQFIDRAELDELKQTNAGILSITVYAEKTD
jgi:arsenite methyltransferase